MWALYYIDHILDLISWQNHSLELLKKEILYLNVKNFCKDIDLSGLRDNCSGNYFIMIKSSKETFQNQVMASFTVCVFERSKLEIIDFFFKFRKI